MKILQEEDCGVDCATEVELLMSHKLGFTDIMFSSNDTPAREFRYAKEIGATINLDAYEHIAFLKEANDYYPELARQLFELAVEVKEKTGVAVSFINLSGGVGVNYRPEQEPNDIAVIGKGVHRVFDEVLIPAGLGDVKIFTELGRFMLAPHGLLVTKVRHRKQTYRTYIGVDASAVNLMRPAMYDAYHHITNVSNPNGKLEVVDVVGSLCENNDKFAKQRELPEAPLKHSIYQHFQGNKYINLLLIYYH